MRIDGTFTEIALKHSLVPPPSLRGQVPLLSSAVEQVVMTALAKDPKERFGSVEAFATALEQASQSLFITSFDLPTPLAPANRSVASPESGQPPSQMVQTTHADSPAPPSRNKQLTRDILAVLSVGLSPIALFLLLTTSFPPLLLIALLLILPYAMGVFTTRWSEILSISGVLAPPQPLRYERH